MTFKQLVTPVFFYDPTNTPVGVSAANRLPVTTDGLTDAQLRASDLPVVLNSTQLTTLTPQKDALTDAQLRASDVNTADSGEREYIHVPATVSAVGDTVIYTPAVGKAIRLRWIYAINDPTASTPTVISVRLGTQEYYRVYALSKRQRITGAVNAPLVINLSALGNVQVTAILEEV